MIVMICSPMPKCGKDTVADYIAMNFKFKKEAFANDVKNIARLVGWNSKKDDKGRELIIGIGEVAKKYNPTIWVDNVLARISNDIKTNYVISDYRFKVENKLIKRLNDIIPIVVIGVERDGLPEEQEIIKENQKEYEKLKKNFVIKNNGTVDELYKEVDNIMRKCLIGNI